MKLRISWLDLLSAYVIGAMAGDFGEIVGLTLWASVVLGTFVAGITVVFLSRLEDGL